MHTLIIVLHIVLCTFLIIVVLLQPGKAGDVSAAFGGGSSQTVFGARGPTSLLQKMTSTAAILFMVTTVSLAWYSSESISQKSVIDADVINKTNEKAKAEQVPPLPLDDLPDGLQGGGELALPPGQGEPFVPSLPAPAGAPQPAPAGAPEGNPVAPPPTAPAPEGAPAPAPGQAPAPATP